MPADLKRSRKTPAPKPAAAPKERRLTASEIAREYHLTPAAVAHWRRAGAPFGEDGKATLAEIRHWELEAERQRIKAKLKPADEAEARARKLAAEAEIREVELAQLRGELVKVVDVAAAYERRLTPLRARLTSFPGKHALFLVGLERPADALAALQRISEELMRVLSTGDEG